MNIVRPTLTMLPLEDIAGELRSDKPGRRFMTKEDKAKDVENVAGVRANLIAQAIGADDRTSVLNSLRLGGIDAKNYLNKYEGEKLLEVSDKITELFKTEIINTRDEVLQLKSDLSKTGIITDKLEYKGFTESFKNSDIKYSKFICKIDKAIIGDTNELFISDITKKHHFEKGKTFVIKEISSGVEHIVISDYILESGKVVFTPSVRCLDSIDNIDIIKTNANYINSSASFSDIQRDVISQKEKYHMQSDDSFVSDYTILKGRTGIAALFKVPDKSVGALDSFEVTVNATGTPGDLICHVLSKDSVLSGNRFDPKFKSIRDAKDKGYLVCSSKPLKAWKHSGFVDMSFSFEDQKTGRYPLLEAEENGAGKQYLFVIECTSASEEDFWKIRFSHHEKDTSDKLDLQRNNMSFVYEEVPDRGMEADDTAIKIKDGIENNDLLFKMITREVLKESEVGKAKGVYTSEITLVNPMSASNARLTARINREGCFYVESVDSSYCVFKIAKETPNSYVATDTRLREGHTVVIGNQIGKIKRVTGNTVELQDPAYIDERISRMYKRKILNSATGEYTVETRVPFYRVGYSMQLKPYIVNWKEWNASELRFETTELVEEPIEMTLKAVIPDRNKDNYRISDRLVYECSFGEDKNNIAKIANDFELQINWTSLYSENEINAFVDNNDKSFKELIGRVHDITLTFGDDY